MTTSEADSLVQSPLPVPFTIFFQESSSSASFGYPPIGTPQESAWSSSRMAAQSVVIGAYGIALAEKHSDFSVYYQYIISRL